MDLIASGVILILLLLVTESLGAIIPLIFGGEKAFENQFSFLVSLRKNEKGEGFEHHCGSSIISERFLLTAAHCLSVKDPNKYRASIGVHSREDQGDVYAVKELLLHPSYNESKGIANDIALILLEKPIKFTANVSTIDIGRDFVGEMQPVLTAGWGETNVRKIFFIQF